MSRSAWKFLPFLQSDLFYFLNKRVSRFPVSNLWYAPRNRTINRLNYAQRISIHQGKFFHEVVPLAPTWTLKIGALSKTRKPFFFRSKKKRNVFKK